MKICIIIFFIFTTDLSHAIMMEAPKPIAKKHHEIKLPSPNLIPAYKACKRELLISYGMQGLEKSEPIPFPECPNIN